MRDDHVYFWDIEYHIDDYAAKAETSSLSFGIFEETTSLI
jgi:hypothetical protein